MEQAETLLPVEPGVDRWVMPEAQMNSVIIADSGEAIVVDPGTLPSRARKLRAAVEARGDRIVSVVITHAHWGHCLAAVAFDGIPLCAHPSAALDFGSPPLELWTQIESYVGPAEAAAIRRLQVALPVRPVVEGETIAVGGLVVELECLAPAHTTGDLLAHIRGRGISIVGDIVETSADPDVAGAADRAGWLRAIERLEARAVPLLIPGHGEPCDSTRLRHHRELLEAAT